MKLKKIKNYTLFIETISYFS